MFEVLEHRVEELVLSRFKRFALGFLGEHILDERLGHSLGTSRQAKLTSIQESTTSESPRHGVERARGYLASGRDCLRDEPINRWGIYEFFEARDPRKLLCRHFFELICITQTISSALLVTKHRIDKSAKIFVISTHVIGTGVKATSKGADHTFGSSDDRLNRSEVHHRLSEPFLRVMERADASKDSGAVTIRHSWGYFRGSSLRLRQLAKGAFDYRNLFRSKLGGWAGSGPRQPPEFFATSAKLSK